MTIFVTLYDLKSKECLGTSMPAGFECISEAHEIHSTTGGRVISQSERLLLIDSAGAGLAFSDYKIRYE